MTKLRQLSARIWALASATLILTSPTLAQEGERDHPLFSAYPSARITNFQETEFDAFFLPVGPIGEDDALPPVQSVEGSQFSVTYEIENEAVSFTQVYRNYEAAVEATGAKVLFSCRDAAECGPKFVSQTYWHGDIDRQGRHNGIPTQEVTPGNGHYAFWSGVAGTAENPQYFSLLVYKRKGPRANARVVLDVFEPKELTLGLISSLTVSQIETSIAEGGKFEIDGLFFDHDESTLQPQSETALEQISAYLSEAIETRFFVVGHTDSVGEYDYNLALSDARARAVVSALTERFAISPERLVAVGVGPVSPISTNGSDVGRAANRRVELVAIHQTD